MDMKQEEMQSLGTFGRKFRPPPHFIPPLDLRGRLHNRMYPRRFGSKFQEGYGYYPKGLEEAHDHNPMHHPYHGSLRYGGFCLSTSFGTFLEL
ncbi:hypothetical protein TIFTF001_025534 [Ficus carica]|uniref:Uncharacterized protein n=1 Tax=Ficus carica TaxID=3494 RepID=A0AA88AJ40_FICCA|nr:hypothetical protein TIFTF001_025534 [Ficus carica]